MKDRWNFSKRYADIRAQRDQFLKLAAADPVKRSVIEQQARDLMGEVQLDKERLASNTLLGQAVRLDIPLPSFNDPEFCAENDDGWCLLTVAARLQLRRLIDE